jgi:hypothetical protein
MIYVAFFEYFTHSNADNSESEGTYTVICEAASPKEVVEDILPRKVVSMGDELSEGDYVEHFLVGLIELPTALPAPVVLGVTEGPLMEESPTFKDVLLAADEQIVRACKLNVIGREKAFFLHGEPPDAEKE